MIHAITYCDRDYSHRRDSIVKNLQSIDYIDTYKCYDETDLPEDFLKIFPSKWFSKSRKGGGWWVWKPYIVKQAIEQIGPDDVLIYVDGGCTLNDTADAINRFKQYIDMINNSVSKMLVFELSKHIERDWTNMYCVDTLKDRYNVSDQCISKYINTPHIITGCFMMKQSEFTCNLCDEWLETAKIEQGDLFSEKHSTPGEKHRHDQSCLSMLYKIHHGDMILPDETWFGSRAAFGGEVSKKYPIWATRTRF
jgi:hypothetical protein